MKGIWSILIGDLWSVHLAIMGILVSVITLLYTSLSSKVEEWKSIKKNKDYAQMQRSTALLNSIKTLRSLNRKVMWGLASTFILFIATTIFKYIPEGYFDYCLVVTDAILTIGTLVYVVYLVRGLYIHYQKERN